MTRIIAGRAKGRRLRVPKHGTRPTSDRVREALFSTLEASLLRNGRSWVDLAVADLYAGSGALGLEAWSRGSDAVTLVDSAKDACRVIRDNCRTLEATSVTVECMDVAAWTQRTNTAWDICFLDPPYEYPDTEVHAQLSGLIQRGLLRAGAQVIVERAAASSTAPFGDLFDEVRERTYGDTRVWYGQIEAPAEEI